LNLEEFYYYYPTDAEIIKSNEIGEDFAKISNREYCLGIYKFRKKLTQI
jgi:hypothetical protein